MKPYHLRASPDRGSIIEQAFGRLGREFKPRCAELEAWKAQKLK
jgi:hypothetical protein